MMRAFFLWLSKLRWAQRAITRMGWARRAARRFVAGEDLPAAIAAVQALNAAGLLVTLDHLGENTSTAAEAQAAAQEVIAALREIQRVGARAGVSIKLSQLGLVLDQALCRRLLGEIVAEARACDTFIRIDMEDSALTDATLAMYHWARTQALNAPVGIVLQSYLYRTAADLSLVLAGGGRVRLCKGAYAEPPAVAFPAKADVDTAYDRLAAQLLAWTRNNVGGAPSSNGRVPPVGAFATHDAARIAFVKSEQARLGLAQDAIEFQMLYGIRRDLQDALAREGYPVRVYVPYGSHWYPYFMRRLAERPENVWFFLSNFFRR